MSPKKSDAAVHISTSSIGHSSFTKVDTFFLKNNEVNKAGE